MPFYGSAKITLKGLSKRDNWRLEHLTKLCTALYNISVSEIVKHYENTGKVIDYQTLKARIKDTVDYKNITGFYYAIMIEAIANFAKYINTNSYTLKKSSKVLEKKNLTDFRPPQPKETVNIMVTRCQIDNGCVILPKTALTPPIRLKLPDNYLDKADRIRRVVVRKFYRTWQFIIEYEMDAITLLNVADSTKFMGIDLGVTNFATCATTDGKSLIVDGKRLKSILQGYCKYRAKLLSASGGESNTKRLASLNRKTRNKVEDYVRKCVSYIVKYCLENRIDCIYLGWGLHFQIFQLGEQNNQMYSLFPFAKFKDALTYKCNLHCIKIYYVDECFTSQASCLDNDDMPDYVTRTPQTFGGHRRYRGLYVSKDGTKINADLNGAYNILRKGIKGSAVINYKQGVKTGEFRLDSLVDLGSRGLAEPHRVKIL